MELLYIGLGVLLVSWLYVTVAKAEIAKEQTAIDELWVRSIDDYRKRAQRRTVKGKARVVLPPVALLAQVEDLPTIDEMFV